MRVNRRDFFKLVTLKLRSGVWDRASIEKSRKKEE